MSSRYDILRELELTPLWRAVETAAAAQNESQPTQIEKVSVQEPRVAPKQVQEPMVMPTLPSPSQMDTDDDWGRLEAEIRACTRCPLHSGRIQGVPGIGDRKASWLIVGEAPGAEEDKRGEPFVGQAGKLLDAMLAAIGLKRGESVYIANVLKSRPPSNRDPSADEVAACLPYLERQIALIQPKIILTLGRFATQSLLATETPIGKLRGQVHRYQGVPVVATYHPAYLLRNAADKSRAWEDLLLAQRVFAEVSAG